jgi:hypothetical protein
MTAIVHQAFPCAPLAVAVPEIFALLFAMLVCVAAGGFLSAWFGHCGRTGNNPVPKLPSLKLQRPKDPEPEPKPPRVGI